MRYTVQPYANAKTPNDRWAIIDETTGCVAVKKIGGRFVQLTYDSEVRAKRHCAVYNEAELVS